MITIHMTTAQRFQSGLLPKAVESVLGQDYQDFEFIICDDASEDGTATYLRELQNKDPRVKVLFNSQNVNSVAVSLAKCYAASSVERPYLTWMFDDNIMRPGALKKLVQLIDADSSLDFVFGQTICHLPDHKAMLVGDASIEYIQNNIGHSSTLIPNAGLLIKRDFIDRVGWYDANILLRRSTDWDLFRRMVHQGKFSTCSDILVEEFGELERDSLRNTYTTTLELMKKYCCLRDAAAWDLSLQRALTFPTDIVPQGVGADSWSKTELQLIYFVMVEYFISIGDVLKASEWANFISDNSESFPWWLAKIKTKIRGGNQALRSAACGAHAGIVYANSIATKNAEHLIQIQKDQCADLQRQISSSKSQIEQLQARNHFLEVEFQSLRVRSVNKLNTALKSIPLLHRLFKRMILLLRFRAADRN